MVIDHLYGNNIACSSSSNAADTIAHVYKIESHLSDWQERLHPDLKLISTADLDSALLPREEGAAAEEWQRLRLRFILTLRYTNIRILLHRTVLVKFLDGFDSSQDSHDVSMLQQVGMNNIQIAILSAKEIISLMHPVIQSPGRSKKRGLLGAWWFSLYYSKTLYYILVVTLTLTSDSSIQCSFGASWLYSHLP